MFKKLVRNLFLVTILITFPQVLPAHAENIPILTWERGQTQNVVLGSKENDSNVKIFLEGQNGDLIPFSRSTPSNSGFYVYSINLSRNLETGGYLVLAVDSSGTKKQVAGVQVVNQAAKEVQRVPLELVLVLFGFTSFLMFLFSGKSKRIYSLKEKVIQDGQTFFIGRSNLFESLYLKIRNGLADSYYRRILENEFAFSLRFNSFLIAPIFIVILVLSFLQFSQGNFISGQTVLLLLVIAIASLEIFSSILASIISVAFLLFNLFTVKTISEILVIFFIGLIFHAPLTYNHFLLTLFSKSRDTSITQKYLINFVAALIASLSFVQLTILIESLSNLNIPTFESKLWFALLLFLLFFIKNYFIYFDMQNDNSVLATRSISPKTTFLIGIFCFLLILSWTNNLFLSLFALVALLASLIPNWLSIKKPDSTDYEISVNKLLFFIIVSIVFYFSIFLTIQRMPLDSINQGNLMILLSIIFNLVLSVYLFYGRVKSSKERIKL